MYILGWPVTMKNWNESNFETLRQLAKMNANGYIMYFTI